MYRSDHVKPDGRRLWLYGRRPVVLAEGAAIPAPPGAGDPPRAHLRRDPIRGEWVAYATHRQDRTFLPSAERDPLMPTSDPNHPTELPAGRYDVAVFENRFPTLIRDADAPDEVAGADVAPARGRCEVVVFSQDPRTGLADLPCDHVALVLEVLAERTRDMAADGLGYVLPFENRGAEMGVTLHHPHAQIYGYGFVPQRQARAAASLREHLATHGRDLASSLAAQERDGGVRLVTARERAVAFVPPFARFPHETWIVPSRPGADLATLTNEERSDVASALSEALQRLDGLWGMPMPYLMTFNQAPTDGRDHDEWTLRIEIWPIRRARDKLKYLAGTELGTDVFASDLLPETAAANLRAVDLAATTPARSVASP